MISKCSKINVHYRNIGAEGRVNPKSPWLYEIINQAFVNNPLLQPRFAFMNVLEFSLNSRMLHDS